MKLNVEAKSATLRTYEGGVAKHINAVQQLRRSVLACMLWEDSFYESGEDIAARILKTVPLVPAEVVSDLAIQARTKMKLRHVPLLLVAAMAAPGGSQRHVVAGTLSAVIQRADELSEFIAIYAKVWGYTPSTVRKHLSAQVKRGLARAFTKFNEYSLAKYDRDGAVKLRDVLFLSHSKPVDAPPRRNTKIERKALRDAPKQNFPLGERSPGELLYERVVNRKLETPDTWEVGISAIKKEDKEAVLAEWNRLLAEKKLGALALLRNLRNMSEAKVDKSAVEAALKEMDAERVLPFRFIAAARAVPAWEDMIEPAMLRNLDGAERLGGHTMLLVDVSGSMSAPISNRSDLMRMDAACGLAILLRELAEEISVITFSDRSVLVPARRGFALRDAIVGSQQHGGTYLGQAVMRANSDAKYDRIIVITDEQAHDDVPPPKKGSLGYVINVAAYKNGVGYGAWQHVDGWSEAVLDYIRALEVE